MASETTPPGDAGAAGGGRRRLDGAGAALGLNLLGLAAYLILAHKQALPVVSQDEYNYGRVARSIADGDGMTLMGGAYRLRSSLYLHMIAPAWLGASTTTAYGIAKAIGAVLLCLTMVPTWLLGRELLGARLALIPAALVLAGTWMTTAGLLLTENLAFPMATAALAATVMAVRVPGSRWGWLALGLSVVASAARLQCVVLVPILLAAILLRAAIARPAGRERLARDLPLLAVLSAVTAVGLVLGLLDPGVLGAYAGVTEFRPSPERLLSAIGHQAIGLVAMTAVLPVVLVIAASCRRAAWADDALAPLLCVIWPAALAFIAESAWMISAFGAWHVERYVEYAVPLLLIATVVIAARRLAAWRDIAVVTLALGLLLLLVAPPVRNAVEERGIYALGLRFDGLLGASAPTALLLTTFLAGAAAVAVMARTEPAARRHLAVTGFALIVGAILLVQSQAGWAWQLDRGSANRRLHPRDLAWVDHAVDGPVANLIVTAPSSLWLDTSLMNRRIERVYAPAASGQAGLEGLVCPWAIADSGALEFDPTCGRAPRRFLLADPYGRLTFYDQTVVRASSDGGSRYAGRVATTPGKPRLRAILLIPCARQRRSQCAPAMSGQFFLDTPGTLIVRFRGGSTPQTINTGARIVPVPPGAITTLRIPVPKGAASVGLRLSWRGPSPALAGAVLVQGPLRTPLL